MAYVLRKYSDFTIEAHFRKKGANIGRNNRIMVRSLGDDPYLIKIGNHCSISSNVAFITHDGGGWIFTQEIPSLQRFGRIEIKDNCYLGMNCIILPGVTIGPNSVVGAGSVVTKDVSANAVFAGNPAKRIKGIEEYREEILAVWGEQKPPGYFRDVNADKEHLPEFIQGIKDRDRDILIEFLKKTALFP